jgi:phage shock protein PspC (stress-responsive transcriptional regulator)
MVMTSILTLLGWPFIIVVSYFIIRWAMNRYEKKYGVKEE